MKLSELRNALLKQYHVDWQMNPKKGMHVDAHYANGFDACAKAVMEEADKLIEALRTAKDQACSCCDSSNEVGKHCLKAINIWNQFKKGKDEPG